MAFKLKVVAEAEAVENNSEICVSCLMCSITGNLATSRFRNLRDISFCFGIRENIKSIKLSAISRTPLFGLYLADWSQNF